MGNPQPLPATGTETAPPSLERPTLPLLERRDDRIYYARDEAGVVHLLPGREPGAACGSYWLWPGSPPPAAVADYEELCPACCRVMRGALRLAAAVTAIAED
jgi:hypothetical protein